MKNGRLIIARLVYWFFLWYGLRNIYMVLFSSREKALENLYAPSTYVVAGIVAIGATVIVTFNQNKEKKAD